MELSDGVWPDRLPAVEVRIARPTDKLGEVVDFSVTDALTFFEGIPVRGDGRRGLDPGIAGPILKEVRERLRFLDILGRRGVPIGGAGRSRCVGLSSLVQHVRRHPHGHERCAQLVRHVGHEPPLHA